MESSIYPLSQFENKDAESWEKAKSVFEKITEQSQFAEIAGCEHISVYFRIRAIEKLDAHAYQDILESIALNSDNHVQGDLRLLAAKLVTNEQIRESVLTDITHHSVNNGFEAAYLLKNQEVSQSFYAIVAKTPGHHFYRRMAIYYLDANLYQSLLVEIAETDDDELVRKEAVKKLDTHKNQQLHVEIAKNHNKNNVQEEAIKID